MAQKIAFITGGNRGLGFQTALDLRQNKAENIKVVIGSRTRHRAISRRQAARRRRGRRHDPVRHYKAGRLPGSHDYFNSKYGRLDILVNNAGIAGGTFPGEGPEHRAADVPMDLLRKVFETNFFAQVELTEKLLPLIKKSPAGRIVNLSSILGSLKLQADPESPIYDAKSFAYDASKTALNAFTVHLAYELKNTKVKVNSAHPGWVKTDMGGQSAPMELNEGGKTSAALATLPDDGPTGGYFHMGKPLPW